YVLTIASFMAVILCIIPDKAPAYCYITAPLVNAAHFGILASAGCMIHTLHNYVVKPTLLTERVRRNQSRIDFVLSIIVPFILTGLTYLNAQYVYGIRPVLGCFIQASQTWVYIIVDGMWPVLISGIGCYFAARTAYTIISKGLEIQSLLKYTKSGLNTTKFYRLVLFCISFLIFAFPTACLTFFSNVTLKPYDFNEVHGNFNQPQTFNNGVTFVDYVKPLTGLFVFVFFGTGHDAKRAYLRWAKTMKLDLCYGYCLKLKKSNNKISSNATTNAAATTTIGRTPPMTNINNINKLSPPTKKSNFFSGHRTPTEQAQFDLTSGIRIRIDGLDTSTIANEEDLEKNDNFGIVSHIDALLSVYPEDEDLPIVQILKRVEGEVGKTPNNIIFNLNSATFNSNTSNVNNAIQDSSSLSPTKLLKSKRKKRSNKPKRTPRPPNAFILYRREKQSEVTAKNDKLTNADVSKVISKMWWKESEQERFRWEKTADRMKLLHMQEYPDYVYKPKKSINKKRKKIIHQKINNNAESTFAD
ncbi:15300_t:CDS:2, partial [Entrophospora sp. SA101]